MRAAVRAKTIEAAEIVANVMSVAVIADGALEEPGVPRKPGQIVAPSVHTMQKDSPAIGRLFL
jgi:hypothetical protein